MAKIPTPDRGQPIDVAYIYTIVEAINELSTQFSSGTYRYASIDTNVGKKSDLITNTKVIAGEQVIYASSTAITGGTTQNFSYSFAGEFKYPPIVTATPALIDNSGYSNAMVTITSITNSRVDGVVRFNTTGTAAIKVNIIAIGIPS